MEIDTPSRLPAGTKSRGIYLLLRNEIADGQLSVGQSLPGEQRLANNFGVSRVTVRRALDALEADGLIDRQGNYVLRPKYNFIDEFDDNGLAVIRTGNSRIRYGLIEVGTGSSHATMPRSLELQVTNASLSGIASIDYISDKFRRF